MVLFAQMLLRHLNFSVLHVCSLVVLFSWTILFQLIFFSVLGKTKCYLTFLLSISDAFPLPRLQVHILIELYRSSVGSTFIKFFSKHKKKKLSSMSTSSFHHWFSKNSLAIKTWQLWVELLASNYNKFLAVIFGLIYFHMTAANGNMHSLVCLGISILYFIWAFNSVPIRNVCHRTMSKIHYPFIIHAVCLWYEHLSAIGLLYICQNNGNRRLNYIRNTNKLLVMT